MSKTLFGAMALALLLLAPELRAAPALWQDLSATRNRGQIETGQREYLADEQALRDALARAPHESSGDRSQLIQLPLADGRIEQYAVAEAPVLAPVVAASYPQIKSYKLYDAASGRVAGRLSSSPSGLRVVLRTDKGRVFVDPRDATLQDQVYVARSRPDGAPRAFRCGVHDGHARDLGNWLGARFRSANRVEGALLQYDIAIAVTLEYYQYFGSDDGAVMTAISDTITRVNEIYERDLGVTFVIVSDDSLYEKSESGQLDNNNADVLLTQVKDWIDDNAPALVYDLGHMFSRPLGLGNSGGVAFLGGVCDAERKAGGVSGLDAPAGDPFDVDYVAHEIGHQFDAEHSFNGTTLACGTGRWAPSAYEPGSGSTIMGYANLCGLESLQVNSDATFHAGSIAQINSFVQGDGSCFTAVGLVPANTDPVIAAIDNKSIPANTPFILGEEGETGRATDTDLPADTLTFQWDQMDTGCPTDADSLGTDNGSNALFRSYEPRAESWRNFPALGTQLRGRYDEAETLPCQQRDLNFRLTVRDQRSGQDIEDVRLRVDNSSGPFALITQTNNATVTAGNTFIVRWDVAGTNLAPVNCDNVDIDLLTFSGDLSSYSVMSLASSTQNDGIESVMILPATSETRTTFPASVARIRVKCSDNVFYALSEGDLTVVPLAGPATTLDDDDFVTRSFQTLARTGFTAPVCPAVAECATDSGRSGSRGGGSGGFGWGLLVLALLVPLARRRRG